MLTKWRGTQLEREIGVDLRFILPLGRNKDRLIIEYEYHTLKLVPGVR